MPGFITVICFYSSYSQGAEEYPFQWKKYQNRELCHFKYTMPGKELYLELCCSLCWSQATCGYLHLLKVNGILLHQSHQFNFKCSKTASGQQRSSCTAHIQNFFFFFWLFILHYSFYLRIFFYSQKLLLNSADAELLHFKIHLAFNQI